MTEKRLLELLDDWSIWMQINDTKLGYPSKSLILQSGGAEFGQGFSIMLEESEEINCIKIDACIDSLIDPQIDAIYARYLQSVEPASYEDHLRFAIDRLLELAPKRYLF